MAHCAARLNPGNAGARLAIRTERGEGLAQAGSVAALLSMLIFAAVVLRHRPEKAVFARQKGH